MWKNNEFLNYVVAFRGDYLLYADEVPKGKNLSFISAYFLFTYFIYI